MKSRILKSQTFFDRQFNLMYLPISLSQDEGEGEIGNNSFGQKKSKSSLSKGHAYINNILIHDIPKEMDFWYFQEADLEEGEYIRSFMFEQYLDTTRRSMQVVGYGGFEVVNNFDLFDRSVQNRFLVETYQPDKEIRRLWLGDKWGIDKLPLMEIERDMHWHYDVYNLMVRVFNTKGTEISFQTLDF